jgi:hypothetical protein
VNGLFSACCLQGAYAPGPESRITERGVMEATTVVVCSRVRLDADRGRQRSPFTSLRLAKDT